MNMYIGVNGERHLIVDENINILNCYPCTRVEFEETHDTYDADIVYMFIDCIVFNSEFYDINAERETPLQISIDEFEKLSEHDRNNNVYILTEV